MVGEFPMQRIKGNKRIPSPIANAFFRIIKYSSELENDTDDDDGMKNDDMKSETTDQNFAPDQTWDPDDADMSESGGGSSLTEVAFFDQLRKQIKSGDMKQVRSLLVDCQDKKFEESASLPLPPEIAVAGKRRAKPSTPGGRLGTENL
jgi:hypothetical protein